VDLALWDLKGKLLQQPVYTLLGGPARERIFCYCTGNDVDWYKELGFKAFKLACPYGPADGLDGIRKNEEFVAQAREVIGEESDLMLDCWMAFDVEYTVRLAETLRPYRLKWMEECLIPEDMDGHVRAARAPALADPGDRRALVHPLHLPVGHPEQGGRHPPARYHVVRWGQHPAKDQRRGRFSRYQRDHPRRRQQCLRAALHLCFSGYPLAGMLRRNPR
jgi:hypothetical protein